MYSAGDVRIENVPDPAIINATDAILKVTRACICGSDLWPYKSMEASETGRVMGHEAIGVVEAVGVDVRTVKAGDLVVMPFAWSDGTCEFCRRGLQTSCLHGGFFGNEEIPGAQAEAVRVPLADGTLYKLAVAKDDVWIPTNRPAACGSLLVTSRQVPKPENMCPAESNFSTFTSVLAPPGLYPAMKISPEVGFSAIALPDEASH